MKYRIIHWLFQKWFAGYVLPFDSSDSVIAQMNEAERVEYHRQAKELLENRVFILEMQEGTRKLMQKLAVGTTSETERIAYRLTLKWVQEFEKKIHDRAVLYKKPYLTNVKELL